VDKTRRCTNTLAPSYEIHGERFSDAAYTRPTPGRAAIADSALLRTDDIPGAYAGWKSEQAPRRDLRHTNFLDDIPGARADSIRPGIVTQRQVNPLEPVYQALDPGQLVEPPLRALVPADRVKMPTIPRGPKAVPNPYLSTGGSFSGSGGFGGSFSLAPGSLRPSPAASARGTPPMTSSERRASQARREEVELVRQLGL